MIPNAALLSFARAARQLVEFILPPLCVAALYFIKLDLQSSDDDDSSSVLRSVVVPPSFPNADDVVVPLSFGDYVAALRARRVCVPDPGATPLMRILGLAPLVISGIDYEDWAVPCEFVCQFNMCTLCNSCLSSKCVEGRGVSRA